MSIKKITINDFISISERHPIIDVRSPGEYLQAHIPGAYNIPLFTDEERKIVGTTYKQQGKQKAIKIGLDFFGPKMKANIETLEKKIKQFHFTSNTIIVHCWRGGMRSAGMAWLFELYGFEVLIIVGGYKAFRNWVLETFETPYDIKLLGGYTGSAKTELLHELKINNQEIIDLEALADHKGSAFGGIGMPEQPTQEMFENMLALQLSKKKVDDKLTSFWLEDESQRIGRLNIPHSLWKTIRKSRLYFIEIDFENRLEFIYNYYGKKDDQSLIDAIQRIQKRLGPNETKTTINLILENKTKEAFRELLKYYDKTYIKSLNSRLEQNNQIQKIKMPSTDAHQNYILLQESINKT
jgi:tRNA 2-selenouridine synthase